MGSLQRDSPLKKKVSPRMLAMASKLPAHRSGKGREGLGRKGEARRKVSGLFLFTSWRGLGLPSQACDCCLAPSSVPWGRLSPASYHAHLTEEDTTARELTQDHTTGEGLTRLGVGKEEAGVSSWAHHVGFGALSL